MAKLLDSESIALVSRLELIARQAVEGFLTGLHPSPYHGSSVEYADHRPYTLGDEPRSVDWKLLAKTDKYYVKLYEDQTNLRATILLDCSRSMAYCSDTGKLPTKFEYACRLAATLAYLMLHQKDAVGLAMFDDKLRQYLPARSTPSHLRLMIEQMEAAKPESATAAGRVLAELTARIKRRGMVILISDLLTDFDPLLQGLAHFRFDRHDVIVFHVMDPAELDFPFEGLTRFKDIEGGAAVVTNPRQARKQYLARVTEFLDRCKTKCLERGISYELTRTDDPYAKMLSAYLERRKMAG